MCVLALRLNTWTLRAGLLSPSAAGEPRWAVAMVNSSPSADTIALYFSKLPEPHLVGLSAADVAAASFGVQDVWLKANLSAVAGPAFRRRVGAHDTALLIVTKLAGE